MHLGSTIYAFGEFELDEAQHELRFRGRAQLAFDPDVPWWMQGPFAPELVEHEALRLEVTGEIPRELEGTFVRNGPNPRRETSNWFLGEGMLHGVRLEG